MDNNQDCLPETREDSIRLVKKIHDEVLKEIGSDLAPSIARKKICSMILDRLPLKPIYGETTIYLIINGTYK
jgi:hypothetical protein